MGGSWKDEWTPYTRFLFRVAIRLRDVEDDLVWAFNGAMGQVSTKLAYDYIVKY